MIGLSRTQHRTAVALFPKRPPTCLVKEKQSVTGLTRTDFKTILSLTKHKLYRSNQIFDFVYGQRGKVWREAEALPKDIRAWLEAEYSLEVGCRVKEKVYSEDMSTIKFLFDTSQGSVIESVLINNEDNSRTTLCISSQAGCSLACTFCATGAQKLQRNLTSAEIIGQYMALPHSNPGHPRPITNLVFMGQGEPLYNWRNLASSIEILTDPKGLKIGRSKVTISTSGIAPLIPKVATDLGVGLAVSLHAPNDDLRSRIMAINKTYPLGTLMVACQEYLKEASSATRRITFEYVMLDGVNDDPDGMPEQLSKLLLAHFPPDQIHVNLLPFNKWPGAPYTCSPVSRINRFRDALQSHGIPCTVRTPKGRDIWAACGQLKHQANA